MTRAPAPRPCISCPYRRDVPSGVWSAEEYEKLPEYDEAETGHQPLGAFHCHQQDGRLCAGWVAVHDMNESLALRMLSSFGSISDDDLEAVFSYSTDVALFTSGAEAAAHGLQDLERPSGEAVRMIGRLDRKVSRASMTEPQRRLLARALASDPEPVVVSGPSLMVAERLTRMGLVTLRIGGSGIAYQAPWWHEIVPTDRARKSTERRGL